MMLNMCNWETRLSLIKQSFFVCGKKQVLINDDHLQIMFDTRYMLKLKRAHELQQRSYARTWKTMVSFLCQWTHQGRSYLRSNYFF